MVGLQRFFRFAVFLFCALAVAPAHAAGLTGSWQGELMGQPLTLVLGANGQGMLDDSPIRYKIEGNELYIEDEGTVNVYRFHQQGNQLAVSGGDLAQPVVLTRGKAAKGGIGSRAAGGAGGQQPRAGGGVRPELVGRWCDASTFLANNGGGSQSSRCMELKADGTYVYAAEHSMDAYGGGAWGGTSSSSNDAGRWTATASTITGYSNGGQTKTYRLEKRNNPKNRDPMICLDGACFVTYWQKAPW
jgi:hypothetical protein